MDKKARIDAKDKLLLYNMQLDCRQSNVALARKVGISRDSVSYRIGKLVGSGAVNCFVAETDLGKLGFTNYGVFFNFYNVDRKKIEEIIAYLVRQPNVLWVASLGGRFDLAVEIAARNALHFYEFYSSFLIKYGAFLTNGSIAIRLYQCSFPHAFLYQKEEKQRPALECPVIRESARQELDCASKKVLDAFTANPRASLYEISKTAGLPPSTVSFKFNQLKKLGILKGFTLLLNPRRFGRPSYKLLLLLEDFSPKTWRKIFGFCSQHPLVSYVVKSIGEWEIEMEVEAENDVDYQEFIMEVRSKFGSVIQEMESVEIFKQHKYVTCPRLE